MFTRLEGGTTNTHTHLHTQHQTRSSLVCLNSNPNVKSTPYEIHPNTLIFSLRFCLKDGEACWKTPWSGIVILSGTAIISRNESMPEQLCFENDRFEEISLLEIRT